MYLAQALQLVNLKKEDILRVMIVNSNIYQRNEFEEFFNEPIFMVSKHNECIRHLSSQDFDIVILHINKLTDLGILGFINTNYPKINVILSLSIFLQEAFDIIKNGSFHQMMDPLNLKQLKNYLKKLEEEK